VLDGPLFCRDDRYAGGLEHDEYPSLV